MGNGEGPRTVANAFQQFAAGNQPAAIESLRPLADDGNEDAIIGIAWLMMNSGQAAQVLPYARRAAELGAISAIANFGPNLIAQGQPDAGVQMLRMALAGGWPHDPLAYAQQLAQQGNLLAAEQLIERARPPPPALADDEIQRVLGSARESIGEISATVTHARTVHDQAVDDIRGTVTDFEAERQRVTELINDVSKLVHNVASDHLAEKYAEYANSTEKTANKYTAAAVGMGVLAAVVSIVIAIVGISGHHDVSTILSRGVLTLPLIAVAGYFGGLARSHRRMAWHWRHVELQSGRPSLTSRRSTTLRGRRCSQHSHCGSSPARRSTRREARRKARPTRRRSSPRCRGPRRKRAFSVSDWIPIAGIVATATVGLGVPIVTSQFDRQKIRDQADEGRRDELRGAIDDAGATITVAIFALNAASSAAWETEAPGLTPQDKDARRKYIPLGAFIERMTELWTYDNRLATRLGSDDEICRAYSTATSALVQALDPMNDVKRGQPYTKDRERQLLSIDDTATEALRALHDAAARRVGLKRRT